MDKSQRDAIVHRDRFVCLACGRRTRGQVHHNLACGQGGSHSPRNLLLPLEDIAIRRGRGIFSIKVRLCKLGRSASVG